MSKEDAAVDVAVRGEAGELEKTAAASLNAQRDAATRVRRRQRPRAGAGAAAAWSAGSLAAEADRRGHSSHTRSNQGSHGCCCRHKVEVC